MDWSNDIHLITSQLLDNIFNIIKLGVIAVLIGLFIWRLGKWILDRVIAGNIIKTFKELKDRFIQKISKGGK